MARTDHDAVGTPPIAVEYAITPLGRSLEPLFQAIDGWARDHLPEVEAARAAFDARSD